MTPLKIFDKKLTKNSEPYRLNVDLSQDERRKLEAIQKRYNYKNKTALIRDLILLYYSVEFNMEDTQ
ncbi:MAG: hypothetical protein ACLFQX_04110 [Candidatus Kapaibacterium sp.]